MDIYLSEEDKSALRNIVQEDTKSYEEEITANPESEKIFKLDLKHCKQTIEDINSLPSTIADNPSTVGFFLRTRYLYNHTLRIRKLLEIKAPNIIIRKEFYLYRKFLIHPKPIRGFEQFAHLKFISFIEKTGRKGRPYLIITTDQYKICCFISRFGLFLKKDTNSSL